MWTTSIASAPLTGLRIGVRNLGEDLMDGLPAWWTGVRWCIGEDLIDGLPAGVRGLVEPWTTISMTFATEADLPARWTGVWCIGIGRRGGLPERWTSANVIAVLMLQPGVPNSGDPSGVGDTSGVGPTISLPDEPAKKYLI